MDARKCGGQSSMVESLSHVFSDPKLIGLKGMIGKSVVKCLLDSGASCNFISLQALNEMEHDYDLCLAQSVRLADGSTLKTCGQVQLRLSFGSFTYCGTFYVLQAKIPCILGMSFFSEVSPVIDWQRRTVQVRSKKQRLEQLPVLKCSTISQHVVSKSRPCATVRSDNQYECLKVDDCDDVSKDDDVCMDGELTCSDACTSVVTPVQKERVQVAQKVCKRVCKSCGKIGFRPIAQCDKCANSSFQHQKLQQCSTRVSKVSEDDVGVSESVEIGTKNSIEVVPLKQFVRGGKLNRYVHFGVITMDQVDDADTVDSEFTECLNFTHRTSHGSGDERDTAHGDFSDLAKSELQRLKQKFSSVFEDPVYPVDRSDCPVQFKHSIPLKDENAAPPKRRLYPLDNVELVELKSQIELFLKTNRIEPSNGPYGSPILFAKKKDGGLRMCIDYRMLNAQSRNDAFPLPRIDELLQRLNSPQVFSKLDLRDGYHQIPMDPSDKQKTAFTCRYGTYQFTVMPFGLMTAPSTFQRMMNEIFFDLLDNGVLCYLDDLLIYSQTVEEHRVLLDKVFGLLQKYKLYIKESKCHLFLKSVNFLGHVVDANGVSLEQGKVDAVSRWPVPVNVKQVQQFLGLCNYYRRFVLRFSELAAPLTLLTRKGQQFIWQDAQQKSFDVLKQCLCSAPVLKVFSPDLKTRVVCDASQFCVGAVLEQQFEGKWQPVEYYSKRLSKAERNYSATDREFVAIRLALEHWRQFLVGTSFVLLTDHAALSYLQTSQHVSRRNARWLEFLSQFSFTIEHIRGKDNVVADALSRVPGSEQLDSMMLCSLTHTLGLEHSSDLLDDDCEQTLAALITIHENDTFLAQLQQEQETCTSDWFKSKCVLAQNGSSEWQFRNGILCRLVADTFCPVLPSSTSPSVHVVLSELHSSALAGHFGARKLLKLAQKRFYWQNMYGTVEKFVRSCPVCAANKGSTLRTPGLLQPVENPSRPFEHVTMDFVTQLPTSVRGFDCIFTIVDRFSRLVRFIPCMTASSAQDIAMLFFEHWVCRHGMPSKIICDRDVRFQSRFWQTLCSTLQCRVAMSTSYHPQTDGLSERFHRSVEQVLRCYCSGQQDQWCILLSQAEYALNSTYQDAIENVPMHVVYGFQPQLPVDTQVVSLQMPAVTDLVTARRDVQSQVTSALQKTSQRMAGVANQSRREMTFTVGDRAWLSTRHLPIRLGARKLAAKWAGPYEVTAKISATAYRLALPSAWRIHPVFHVSQMKEVVAIPPTEAPVQLDDGGEEFEVERLLDMRVVRGRREFLVKWKGYGDYENSWEPESNLVHSQELLQQFLGQRARVGSAYRGRRRV